MPHILVVDDEELLRACLRRLLERAGYAVSTASSADEALAVLTHTPVQMVISDLKMPGRSGLELMSQIQLRWPPIRRVVLTGAPDDGLLIAVESKTVQLYLTKPWDGHQLLASVAGLFAQPPG
jgi:CheY-like chemotaxis protein